MEVFVLIFFVVLYFAPTIVANSNRRKNATAITLLNIFAGWTGIGWLVALIWSVME